MSTHPKSNRLKNATSPYLLQHARNPVDWFPWGAEAFEKARSEDKPIIVSVGYAACHWCHVMERESFENKEIAELMNTHFVPIKIDREERPDIDAIYMQATVAMNGSGGWPMTVFCTPDKVPFFAGTYYPPAPRHGLPGFPQLLLRIAELWRENREDVLTQAKQLGEALATSLSRSQPGEVSFALASQAVSQLSAQFDAEWGGFGSAPKFPQAELVRMLLRVHASQDAGGNEAASHSRDALGMAVRTLNAMKDGGMYDQLAGGFARYSTDREWLVPHFEKMLYDNAQLSLAYTEAWQLTKHPEYKRIACETLDYLLRDMQSDEGGFFSATDADSEGEEGKYFVFYLDEFTELLGVEVAELAAAHFGVTAEGNWLEHGRRDGRNVLHLAKTAETLAEERNASPESVRSTLQHAREKLLAARAERIAPLLDDKILVSWNALTIRALAEAALAFSEPRYLTAAQKAADFILGAMREPAAEGLRLFRAYRQGKAHISAILEDYAYLCEGLISLYEAGGETRYLFAARDAADEMLSRFASKKLESGFYQTPMDHEELIVRAIDSHDGATPSANALAAGALVKLAQHLAKDDYRGAAEHALKAHGAMIARFPQAFPASLIALQRLEAPEQQVVFAGDADAASMGRLRHALGNTFAPTLLRSHLRDTEESRALPLHLRLHQAISAHDEREKATAFVCQNHTCLPPTSNPDELRKMLRKSS